jgi:TatD DNase family protein
VQSDLLSVLNLFPEEFDQIKEDGLYSIGLHPWEICKGDREKKIEIVKVHGARPEVIAVGEIGLDKYKEEFDLQKDVFIRQIEIAKTLQKPIIIHCVKAFSELSEILKLTKPPLPVILHRYSGNKTIVDQLIKYNCFFSFGHELFNERSKTHRVFKAIPLSRIFLETDDSDYDIEDIYKKAADLKEIKPDDLILAIRNNFARCFKTDRYETI